MPSTGLPVSRGSAVDSELALLMREFPRETTEFLDAAFHKEPARYKGRRVDPGVVVAARQPHDATTHYRATFVPKDVRPRSNKRPPPTPRDPDPPPMHFDTWQRSVFVPKDLEAARTLPCRMVGQTELSNEKLDTNTSYRTAFTAKPLPPTLTRPGPGQDGGQSRRLGAGGKFYDNTTTGEHYQPWTPQKTIQFGELPSFTSSILYPTAQRTMRTEMQDSFKGSCGRRADQISQSAPNIKLEGDHDFLTTSGLTYRKQEATEPTRPARIRPQLVVDRRKPLFAETQSMHDFPGFQGKQPRPPLPVEPLKPTIDLKYDQQRYFDTEQRTIFKGHDILKNPVPEPFAPGDKFYRPPKEKFATTTVTKSDFMPIAVEDNIQVKAHIPESRQTYGGKFYDATTNKDFFQDWTPQTTRRIRHGDFHEAYKYNVPAVYKLEGQSETKDSFIPMKAESVANYKPEHKPIERTDYMNDMRCPRAGDHIFDTEYNRTFRARKHQLTRQQAAQLKKLLQQHKDAKKVKGNTRPMVPVA